MAKVVYTDWRDRMEEPKIIGVYEDDNDGYRARETQEDELRQEGYDTDEEVKVWIEDIEITRKERYGCTKVTIDVDLEKFRYSLVGDGYLLNEVKDMSDDYLITILKSRIERHIEIEYERNKRYGLIYDNTTEFTEDDET